jgi:hypothetical protein
MYAFAKLDAQQLESLRDFESQTGVRLLALSEVDVAPAQLDDPTLGELKRLEGDLGITLVAVQ